MEDRPRKLSGRCPTGCKPAVRGDIYGEIPFQVGSYRTLKSQSVKALKASGLNKKYVMAARGARIAKIRGHSG
jgi:hypothetical protein